MNQPVSVPPHVPADRVVDFDLYNPPQGRRDFHGAWLALRQRSAHDIVWTPHNEGHWLVLRAPLVQEVLADPERFSSRVLFVPKSMGQHHQLLPSTLDPPRHRPYRSLLNHALSHRAIAGVEGHIRQLAAELIEAVRTTGQCNFTTAYAEQLPIRNFMRLVDLPIEDAAQIKYWTDQTTRPDGSMRYEDAIQAFHDYLGPWVDRRRGSSEDNLITRLVNGEVDGRPLSRDEAIKLCAQTLIAGLDTVVNLLGFVMLFLATHPEHRRRLAAEPALIPAAVEELARRFGVVCVAREVTRDMDYGGVQLRQGEMIVVPTLLHGLDPDANADPLSVDFDRERPAYSTFGNGAHRCPGSHLGRTEIRITLEEWLARIPEFEVEPGADITYSAGVVSCVDRLPLVWDTAATRTLPIEAAAAAPAAR